MKKFSVWLAETTQQKNKLATLVQQGVGSGDRAAWGALLDMLKQGDDLHIQSIRQLVSGYTKHEGKPGAAARYVMDMIDEIEGKNSEKHFGEKAQEAVNNVQETLFKLAIPTKYADALLDVLEAEANNPAFMMQRNYVGANLSGKLMNKVMPILVQIAEYLLSAFDEKHARDAMIEILGDLTYFSEHVPTVQMIFNRARQG